MSAFLAAKGPISEHMIQDSISGLDPLGGFIRARPELTEEMRGKNILSQSYVYIFSPRKSRTWQTCSVPISISSSTACDDDLPRAALIFHYVIKRFLRKSLRWD